MKSGTLLIIWLSGICLVFLSLYSTHILLPGSPIPPPRKNPFSLTIFAAPLPFEGINSVRQTMAIHSWLALHPRPSVVLLAQHPSVSHFVDKLPAYFDVIVDSTIDFTFLGEPMFHSMVARARASTSDIVVLVEPDVLLFPDFIDVLNHVHHIKHDWLLVAMSQNVSHFPFYWEPSTEMWFENSELPVKSEKVQSYVQKMGMYIDCKAAQLWAWNTGKVPLHLGVMPPFLYHGGWHNEWLLNEALFSDLRFTLDVTESISLVYANNLGNDSTNSRESFKAKEKRENNAHLSALYGSYYFRPPNFSNVPIKLIRCSAHSFCFVDTLKQPPYCLPMELWSLLAQNTETLVQKDTFVTSFKRYVGKAQRQLFRHNNGLHLSCNTSNTKVRTRLDCPVESLVLTKPQLTLNLALPALLERVASPGKLVVLTVVGNNYRDLLMSWVCRLKHLGISNFLIAAVDDDIYQFALFQGLPVFKNGPAMNVSFDDCHFGTKCFQRVTKMKSRTVLQILRLGYHVLFSDVDIYWFSNPIQELMSFGPEFLLAQSDEYNETEALNIPRRLNSGFYFAWSSKRTVNAFERIVQHAANSNASEQPSFYDTLCGEHGENRQGDSLCVDPVSNLTVRFLDRNKYPNGAYKNLWEAKNVQEACKQIGCVILHNNWINARYKKLRRQIDSGLWDYDAGSRMCSSSWQGPNSIHFY